MRERWEAKQEYWLEIVACGSPRTGQTHFPWLSGVASRRADFLLENQHLPLIRDASHGDTGRMALQPRHDLPRIPQHIVQRGNNRLPYFLDAADRRRYLHLLREALLDTDGALHAYVLMDNHVHLLVTPPKSAPYRA